MGKQNNSMVNGLDYGPLVALIGQWEGDKGMDVAPEPDDGVERNPYRETLKFEAIGDATNAESQILAVLHYHQVVNHTETGKEIHNETGYWMWDKDNDTVMHSLTIPRGLVLLAGGAAVEDAQGAVCMTVEAQVGHETWGIVQSPFLTSNAKTMSYYQQLSVSGDQLKYSQTMGLDIYGRNFEHTDNSTLYRV